jgi:hypothetical protein
MPVYGTNNAARYLPAVNKAYAETAALEQVAADRHLPTGFKPSDLAFWTPNNRYFHYPYALHSVGLYNWGTRIDNALTRTSKQTRTLLGDSGGFQLGRNTEPFNYKSLVRGMSSADARRAWHEAEDLRDWIVGSLTASCNLAMTIDIPLWSTLSTNTDSAFNHCSVDELIVLNRLTLDYIERTAARPNNFRWLNVIQGLDIQTIDRWIDAVHEFRHGGWALGGAAGVRGGVANVVHTLSKLDKLGCFKDGNDWVHVLGVGTADWAVYLTAIQQRMREKYPAFTVSFDNATPFSQAGRFERMMLKPSLGETIETWTIPIMEAPQGLTYCTSPHPFSQDSEIGRDFSLAMLNPNDDPYAKNRFDQLSHFALANHNVNVMLDAFERANYIATAIQSKLPYQVADTLRLIRAELA